MGHYRQSLSPVCRTYSLAGGLAFWIIAALVCLNIGPPGIAQAGFYFSHDEDASYASLAPEDHQLVVTSSPGVYGLYAWVMTSWLSPEVNIDALDLLSGDGVVFSLSEDTEISGTYYADEDLLFWKGTNIGLLWEGSANGLRPEVNLDAVDIISESPLVFSFSLEEDADLTGLGLVADEDVVRFTFGSGFTGLDFDGSYRNVPPELDLNGFSRYGDAFILSFDAAGEITYLPGPTVSFDDGDLIKFDLTAVPAYSLYFDASAQSIPEEVELNAIAFPTPTPAATPVKDYTFDSGVEDWSFQPLNVPPYFYGASSSYTGGRLTISSASDTTSRVGFWNGPTDLAYVADNVYRARFLASSSQATASENPQFRMRWIQDQALESASHVVNASAPYSYSLPTDPTSATYSCYFAPVLSGNMGVAFDMLDFSAGQYGTHYVDQIIVERFSDPTTVTAVKTYRDSADFGNWGFVTNVGYEPVESGGAGTDTLSITSTLPDASNYGWWQSNGMANELTYVADKLYRATYTLSATDADRDDLPQVRLRCQSEDGQMTVTMELNSQGVGGPGAMPALAGTDYDLYFETPTLPGLPTTMQDGFIVTIDVLDFNPAQGGTIYMESVAIDYVEIP